MKVTIISYDPVKGRGSYRRADGVEDGFSYRQFLNEVAIPTGRTAKLVAGVLHPIQPGKWARLVLWLKEVFKCR